MRAKLTVLNGPSKGQVIPLEDGVTRFGRRPDNDVVIDDPAASRFHAEIHCQQDKIILKKVSETALVKVDSVALAQMVLENEHKIRFGKTYYYFKRKGAKKAVKPAPRNLQSEVTVDYESPDVSKDHVVTPDIPQYSVEPRDLTDTIEAPRVPDVVEQNVSHGDGESIDAAKSFSLSKVLQVALFLVMGGIAFFVMRSIGPEEMEVTVLPYRAGEEKLIDLSGYLKQKRIVDLPQQLSISQPDIMRAKLDPPPLSILWFKTLEQGECEVLLMSRDGTPLLKFLFVVKGQVEQDSERYDRERKSREERLADARELMLKAELVSREEMMGAYSIYEEALALIASVSKSSPLYFKCRRAMEKPKAEVEKRLLFLWKEANNYRKNKDYATSLEFIDEILALMKSSKSLDHQRAQIHKKHILKRLPK